MMIKNILVYLTHSHVDAWNFRPEHQVLLEKLVPGLKVEICMNSKEFKERLPKSEAVIVWFFKEEWLGLGPQLKLIATPAAGNDWIEIKAGNGPQVLYGGFHGAVMAEIVVGAMMYFLKSFPLSVAMQKQKKWARVKISGRLQSLYKSRVTILGFGRIGKVIAERLKPFGCCITGIKRNPVSSIPAFFSDSDRVLTFENWENVFAETDHLICALPNEASKILQTKHFKALPRTCYLYNVGRGNAYKEADLVKALRTGEIAGAYLDVFEEEPLPQSSPLWEFDSVLIQPHTSAVCSHYLELFVEELAEKINADLFGVDQ
ncbi:MAG: D-2-hydroxyacid dehydrogenase [Nitrospinae bacterium]|nr:D-2-hydroxyacid dehydrogenase [Nitrospinota bacterium]